MFLSRNLLWDTLRCHQPWLAIPYKRKFELENHRTKWVMFHCHVSFPEGIINNTLCLTAMKQPIWRDADRGNGDRLQPFGNRLETADLAANVTTRYVCTAFFTSCLTLFFLNHTSRVDLESPRQITHQLAETAHFPRIWWQVTHCSGRLPPAFHESVKEILPWWPLNEEFRCSAKNNKKVSNWWYTYPPEKYESLIGSSSQLLGK